MYNTRAASLSVPGLIDWVLLYVHRKRRRISNGHAWPKWRVLYIMWEGEGGKGGGKEGRDGASFVEDLPVVEFMYLAFTRMPGEAIRVFVVAVT